VYRAAQGAQGGAGCTGRENLAEKRSRFGSFWLGEVGGERPVVRGPGNFFPSLSETGGLVRLGGEGNETLPKVARSCFRAEPQRRAPFSSKPGDLK
jgi:hypothetical protein